MSAVIGATAGGAAFSIDVDELVGQHLGIVANSGGGKSGALRVVLEQTSGQIQQIVLDIEDAFYTLRESGDYVILGGDDSDGPAPIAGARQLARTTLDHGYSLIVQLNDLGEQAPDYVAEFIAGLMSAPKASWHPVMVVIDEAQMVAPGKSPTAANGAVRDLLYRGRKRGFTAVLASLRLAEAIEPAIRGMINNWLLGRTGSELDRNAMAGQLGLTPAQGREMLSAVLARQFYAIGPALSISPELVMITTAKTTIVERGQARAPTPPAPEALRSILAELALPAVPEPLTATDADVEQLRHENAALKAAIERMGVDRATALGIGQSATNALLSISVLVLEEAERIKARLYENLGIKNLVADNPPAPPTWDGDEDVARGAIPCVPRATDNETTEVEAMSAAAATAGVGRRTLDAPAAAFPKSEIPAVVAGKTAGGGQSEGDTPPAADPSALGSLAQRFLAEMERRHPALLSWENWAVLVGRKARGAQFNTALGQLRAAGAIVEEGDRARARRAGADRRGGEDPIALWRAILPGMARKIFDALIDAGDGPYAEIAERIGRQPQGPQWNAAISQLRANSLVADKAGHLQLNRHFLGITAHG